MIWFTGDTHGADSVNRLSHRRWPRGRSLTRDDYVVICGDFGLVWSPLEVRRSKEDRHWLDWLEGRPWTTLFVDGNHENHDMLDAMPEVPWRGGMVHEVRPHVLHLMRGYAFDLPVGDHVETLLAFGGARSHDIEWRTEGVSWWPRELPESWEFDRCRRTLDARGWRVDWVATHDMPGRLKGQAIPWEPRGGERRMNDRLNGFLDELDERLDFRCWYLGHYHFDAPIDDRHAELYRQVVPAGAMPREG